MHSEAKKISQKSIHKSFIGASNRFQRRRKDAVAGGCSRVIVHPLILRDQTQCPRLKRITTEGKSVTLEGQVNTGLSAPVGS